MHRQPRTAPRFQGGRLIEARIARNIHAASALAGLVGVKPSSVSRWEDGSVQPTPEMVSALERALNVRAAYFFRPLAQHAEAPVFLRSLASARKRDLAYQRARLAWLQDVAAVVTHYVELPALDLPDLLGGVSFKSLRDEDIEEIAVGLRRHWGLGAAPVPNVVDVIERAGFIVGTSQFDTDTLDGMCQWSARDGRPYILLATDKASASRRQMDAAHEMAHAVLHRAVTPDELRDDFALIERQAFRLASAFLMPAEGLALHCRPSMTLRSLLPVRDTWHVSVKAMLRRFQDLGLLPPDEAVQFYKYYSALGWRRGEPGDAESAPAEPTYLFQAVQLLVDSGRRSKAELLNRDFAVPALDIEALLSMPDGWFSREAADVVRLQLRPAKAPSPASDGGQVVAFTASIRRPTPARTA